MATDKNKEIEKDPSDVGASAAKVLDETAGLADKFEQTLDAQKQQANTQRAGVAQAKATTFAAGNKKGKGATTSQATTKQTKSSR